MESFLTLFVIALLWTIWSDKRKRNRKPRTIDAEYQQLVETHMRTIESGNAVKNYLLEVLDDCANDREKFSDAAISKAEKLYEEIGPGGYYWMTEIAAQFVLLGAAKMNEIPTSVDLALKAPVTPEQLVNEVVRVK
jgi:hypothetical protein